MKLVLEASGSQFDVYTVDLAADPLVTDNAVRTFLDTVASAAKKSFLHLYKEHRDHGPIHNAQKCRHLGDGIYEWKANQGPGWRLYYFNDGRRTILTHGSPKRKKAELAREIAHAKSIRDLVEGSGL